MSAKPAKPQARQHGIAAVDPAPVPLKPINFKLHALPKFVNPIVADTNRPAEVLRAIKPTSFLPVPPPLEMRVYNQATIDHFNPAKGFGFASYVDRETRERCQYFFHADDYRTPETFVARAGRDGKIRSRVVQMAPGHTDSFVRPPEIRDAIYYILGSNNRGPCIVQWTTVLEYNEHLDFAGRKFNLEVLAATTATIYELYISKPHSKGMHCNPATKSYEERYEYEEKLVWVGNDLNCQHLCEMYIAAENVKPACRFRWRAYDSSYNLCTGEWTARNPQDCESPVEGSVVESADAA